MAIHRSEVVELDLFDRTVLRKYRILLATRPFRERDRSGKCASEGGTTECVLGADSPVTLGPDGRLCGAEGCSGIRPDPHDQDQIRRSNCDPIKRPARSLTLPFYDHRCIFRRAITLQ